jgi:tetratricopeptide (TPR) repeat protein
MKTADLLLRAIECERKNRLDDAERFYITVNEREPNNFDALHGRGVICYRKGDVQGAERWVRKAIGVNPMAAHAYNNLGSILLAAQRLDPAIEHYRRAVSIAPDFADARNNLAAALTRTGDLVEARKQYEIALRIEPDHADANNNLGVVLERSGHDGVTYFEKAVRLNPEFPDALNNLGTALLARGNPEAAIELCGKAVKLRHAFPEGHNSLGNALARLGRHQQAIRHYQTAIAQYPDFAEAHNNLGSAFDAVDEVQAAIACFEKAGALNVGYADPHANLGMIHTRYGRLEEARREFERAVELAPGNTKFLVYLAELKRFETGDPHIEIMERMSDDTALADGEKVGLHFALSKAYMDFDDHESAAKHMVKGNSLKRRQIDYDEKSSLEELSRLRELFSAELMRRHSGAGNPSDVPIFIVGMPRSGTTLIEQILASHERVFGADELRYFSEGVLGLPGQMGANLQYPEFISAMTEDWLVRLGDDYLRAVRAMAPSAMRITDKMPANFRFVGLIHLALPNARIIHARRDAVDNCLSCYSILFTEGQAFTYDLGELGRLYKGYDRLMRHWHEVLPAGVMIDVHYEELVANFESEARRILAHCDLEWSPACLDFHRTSRAVRTASATQVRQPLYATAVGRWRPYAKMLQPLLDELGIPTPLQERGS